MADAGAARKPEVETYTGGCHCGKVRYQVTAALENLVSCNCSICSKKGWVLAFVPAAQFQLLSGEDALTDYQFNKHNIHHLFCATCGISSFARGTGRDGSATFSINVRCLDGVDATALPVKQMDGRSR